MEQSAKDSTDGRQGSLMQHEDSAFSLECRTVPTVDLAERHFSS
jgi:hypothetical protein